MSAVYCGGMACEDGNYATCTPLPPPVPIMIVFAKKNNIYINFTFHNVKSDKMFPIS